MNVSLKLLMPSRLIKSYLFICVGGPSSKNLNCDTLRTPKSKRKQGKMMRGTTTAQKHEEIEKRHKHQETPHNFLSTISRCKNRTRRKTLNIRGGLSQGRCLHYGATDLNVKPIAPVRHRHNIHIHIHVLLQHLCRRNNDGNEVSLKVHTHTHTGEHKEL